MNDPLRHPDQQPDPRMTDERAAEMFLDWPWARRTVGALRQAVANGTVAKTELQLYGLDWSQLADVPDSAILADVLARRGAVTDQEELSAAEINYEAEKVPRPPAPEAL